MPGGAARMDDRDVAIELIAKDMATRAIRDVGRELGGLRGIARSASDALRSAGQDLQRIGRDMATKVTLPIVGAGLAIWQVGRDFERNMNLIHGLVGVSREQLAKWKPEIEELAVATAKGPNELVEALYFVTSSGIDASESMAVLESSARAASAGLGDTQVVADALTSIINAYGAENISAARATDIMVAAVKAGKIEADGLAQVIGRVVPAASQLGVAFDDVGGALASMSLVGLDVHESATSLANIFNTLLKPTKDAEKALKEVGLTTRDLKKVLKEEGTVALLQLLNDKFEGNEDALARVFPNIRALRGAFALLSQDTAKVAKVQDAVTNSTGLLDQAFAAIAGDGTFTFDSAVAQLQVTMIEFFDAVGPIAATVLAGFSDVLSNVTEIWKGLSPEVKQAIVVILGLAAAIGPVLIVLGLLASALGAGVAAVGALLSPVLLIGGALAAVAVHTGAAGAAFDAIRPVIDTITKYLGIFAGVLGAVLDGTAGIEQLGAVASNFLDEFSVALGGVVDTVLDAIPGIIDGLGEMALAIGEAVIDAIPVVGAAIGRLAEQFIGWIGPRIPGLLSQLAGWAQTMFSWILQQAPVLLNHLLELGRQLVTWVTARIPDLLAALSTWAQSIFDWLVNTAIPQAAAALGPMALAFVDWVFEMLPLLLDALDDVIGAILNFIVTNGPVLVGKLIEWAVAFVGWIATEVVPRLIENLPTILRTILLFLGGAIPKVAGKAAEIGGAILKRIIEFVGRIPGRVADFLGSMIGKIAAAIPRVIAGAADLGGKFLNGILDFVARLPGRVGEVIVNFLGAIPGWAGQIGRGVLEMGRKFVSGFISGLARFPGAVADTIGDAFRSLKIDIGPFHISASGVRIDLPKIELPSFDVGAWKLPSDMVATVHKGEMIIPADVAARLRGETAGSRGFTPPTPASGGGGMVVVQIENHYGAGSVRSAEDIREISRQQAENIRLLGFRPSVRSSAGIG